MEKILYILILLVIIGSSNLKAQIFLKQRELRPKVESNDTTHVMVDRNKLGQIIKLSQEFNVVINGVNYLFEEEYKKDKYWYLWRYKDVDLSSKRVILIPDGEQFHFNNEGRVIGIQIYKSGKIEEISKEFEYYPNGKIKFVAEVKNKQYWNFILYKYPDGKDFTFGSFKNGKGEFIMLDNTGNPCQTYETTSRKLKVKQ